MNWLKNRLKERTSLDGVALMALGHCGKQSKP